MLRNWIFLLSAVPIYYCRLHSAFGFGLICWWQPQRVWINMPHKSIFCINILANNELFGGRTNKQFRVGFHAFAHQITRGRDVCCYWDMFGVSARVCISYTMQHNQSLENIAPKWMKKKNCMRNSDDLWGIVSIKYALNVCCMWFRQDLIQTVKCNKCCLFLLIASILLWATEKHQQNN